MRKKQQGEEGRCMRKDKQEGKVGGWGRYSRMGGLVDEEGTAVREGWWMRKE